MQCEVDRQHVRTAHIARNPESGNLDGRMLCCVADVVNVDTHGSQFKARGSMLMARRSWLELVGCCSLLGFRCSLHLSLKGPLV